MEENNNQKSSRSKWLRMLRKVAVGAIIMFFLNLALNAIGWNSWEKFSAKANGWSETIRGHVYRMSPVVLWQSHADNSPAAYEPGYRSNFTGRLYTWLTAYCSKSSGQPFWIGRLILVLVFVCAILLAMEDHAKSTNKTKAGIVFPFNVCFKAIVILLVLSMLFLFIHLVIKLLLKAHASAVVPVSGAHLGISLLALTVEEIKGYVADESKERTGRFLFPFLYSKKKDKDGPGKTGSN